MFKKFLLGLGLLGVVSSANASYINIEAGYYYLNGKQELKSASKVAYLSDSITEGEGTDQSYFYTVTFTAVSGGVQKGVGAYGISQANTGFIPDGTILYTGCSVNAPWAGYCPGTTVRITVMPGDINDAALKSEVDALKAKLQALENKVYSCVQ